MYISIWVYLHFSKPHHFSMASSRVFSIKTPLFQAAQEPVGLSQCRCSQEWRGGTFRLEEATVFFLNTKTFNTPPFFPRNFGTSPFPALFFWLFSFFDGFWKNGPFLVGSDPVDRCKDLRDFTQGKTSITLRFLLADSVLEGMTVNVKMPQRYFN